MAMTEIYSKAKGTENYASQCNPNSSWVNHRGAWVTNILILVILRIFFSSIPSISIELAWTLTNVIYLVGHFILFHLLVGTPFADNNDQGEFEELTLWEQMDYGVQFTPTKKYLTALPIAFFLLSTHYTHYDDTLFLVNFVPLVIVLIAKLPALHRVRLFGLNRPRRD